MLFAFLGLNTAWVVVSLKMVIQKPHVINKNSSIVLNAKAQSNV